MNFEMYTNADDRYIGNGRWECIPTKGDYIEIDGYQYQVKKVVYNHKNKADLVKIVINTH